MSSDSGGGESDDNDEDGTMKHPEMIPDSSSSLRNPTKDKAENSAFEENQKKMERDDGSEERGKCVEEKRESPAPVDAAEDSEIEDPVEDALLQAGLAEASQEYYASPVYESSAYAQAPKLEPIAEHEILEVETPAATSVVAGQQAALQSPGEEFSESGLLAATPVFSLELDSAGLLSGGDLGTDRSSSPLAPGGRWDLENGESVDFSRPHSSYISDSVLARNYTEPSGLSSVLRQVHSFVGRRFFGSTAVTPSDSLQSLEFGTSINHVPHSMGSSRLLRHGYSSRNSVSSEGGRRSARRKRSNDERKTMMAGPSGQVVSRSKRFLTKGTAGFLHAKGTSAISLRPADMAQGLPSPCGECPHCRKFLKLGDPGIPLRALGQTCPCRICTILEDNAPGAPTRLGNKGVTRGKTPGGLGGRQASNTGDYGAFCEACSQSGTIDGRCSRYSMTGLSGMPPGPPVQPHVVVGGGTRSVISGVDSETPSMESLLVARQNNRDIPCGTSRQVSMSSISVTGPMCRICHSTDVKEEPLLSPCRCLGTLKHVHMSCLVHWLEISCRKLRKPAQCELCGYRYQRHKVLNLRNCIWPKCSKKDKILHSIFIVSIMVMLICAAVTIVCFKADQHGSSGLKNAGNHLQSVELTGKEVVTLVCGVMFFVGFFVAMYVQVKAHATLYKLIVRFWTINHEWFVEEYRPSADPEWVKKTRQIRQELAAAAAATGNAVRDEQQRFLSVPGGDGSEMTHGMSGSTSRRSSLSSELNLTMMERRGSDSECEQEEEGEEGAEEREKVFFRMGSDRGSLNKQAVSAPTE